MKTNKEKHSKLTSLLTGWGISECWAKLLAGAVIGALSAIGLLTLNSCTTTYTQSAQGEIRFKTTIVTPAAFRK